MLVSTLTTPASLPPEQGPGVGTAPGPFHTHLRATGSESQGGNEVRGSTGQVEGGCYSLDLKSCPKAHVLKAWSIDHGATGKQGNF